MKSRGSSAKTKWTATTRTHLSRSCLIHCTTKCMSVLTECLQTNSGAKKRKKFVRSGTVSRKGKCIRRVSNRGYHHGCLIMMGWSGMKSKWMSTQATIKSRNRIQIPRVKGTRESKRKRRRRQICSQRSKRPSQWPS